MKEQKALANHASQRNDAAGVLPNHTVAPKGRCAAGWRYPSSKGDAMQCATVNHNPKHKVVGAGAPTTFPG